MNDYGYDFNPWLPPEDPRPWPMIIVIVVAICLVALAAVTS